MSELKELDLQKLAGKMANALWSSVKKWDYFTQDAVGREVAKAADNLWGEENGGSQNGQTISIPIDEEETITRPSSPKSIAISFDDEEEIETNPRELPEDLILREDQNGERNRIFESNPKNGQDREEVDIFAAPSLEISFDDEEEIETNSRNFSEDIDLGGSQTEERDRIFESTLKNGQDRKEVDIFAAPSLEISFDDEEEIETNASLQNLQTLEEDIFSFPVSIALDIDDREEEEIETDSNITISLDPILTPSTMENQPPANPSTPRSSQPLRNPEGYEYFLTEARELLTEIEQQLFALTPEASTNEIYSLMRATHTLKGASANVGCETIKIIAHNLEDVFRAMLAPEAIIDQELESLLFEGYDCLRLAISAELASPEEAGIDDDLLNRAADLFARFQAKLGDCFDHQPPLPTSEELGFDLTKSIFEVGVNQRIEELKELLSKGANQDAIATTLTEQANVFVGLGESLGLPGFGAIATAILAAIAAHPEQAIEIAQLALEDLEYAQKLVLEGDRKSGGQPSQLLLELARETDIIIQENLAVEDFDELEIGQDLEDLLAPATVENSTLAPNEDLFSVRDSELQSEPNLEFNPDLELDIVEEFPLISPVERQELEASFEELDLQNSPEDAIDFDLDESVNPISEQEFFSDSNFESEFGELEVSEISQEVEKTEANLLATEAIDLEATFGGLENLPEEFNLDVQTEQTLDFEPETTSTSETNIKSDSSSDFIPSSIWDIDDDSAGELLASELDLAEEIALDNLPIEEEIFLNEPNLRLASPNIQEIPSLEETFGSVDLGDTLTDFPEESEPIFLDDLPKSVKPQQKPEKRSQVTSSTPETLSPSNPPQIEPGLPSQPIAKTLRIDLEQLELFNHLVAELLINQNQLSLRDEQFQTAIQKLTDWIRQHRLTLNQLRDLVNHTLSKKGSDRNGNYKQIHPLQKTLYSALEEASQITQATEDINLLARTTTSTIEREQRLSNQLRDNVQTARMSPLENLLKRFPPMVKQLSFIHKKSVNLQIQGGQIMVDKTIIDNLYDALLHLVRNAFDHGIESPEIRRQRGKPETGNILIRAYNQGNRTIIEVRDDGEGLNVEKICQQGIKKGLIGDREAREIQHLPQPEARLLDLLCSPGFSTAFRVSDLSGRGVGLDVVKTQLEQIKGILNVQSIPQQGTIFSLQIRESLMNARLLICQAGRSVYGFVSNEVEQVLIPGEKIRRLAGQKVLDWQQEGQNFTIPIYELVTLFNYSRSLPQCRGLAGGEFQYQELSPILTTGENVAPILLLKGNEGFIALEVDRVLEEQELVIKPLSNTIAPPAYIYGCSILADGRLALAIDGFALVGQSHNKEAIAPKNFKPKENFSGEEIQLPTKLSTQTLGLYIPESDTMEKKSIHNLPSSPIVSNQPKVKTILVIDDSLTERQTLTLILQRSGYHILQAKDGLEALEQLKSRETIHVALCDIEMPRMNGLEFLSVVKQDKTLSNIPAIVLTSRSQDKFKQIALELGAYAYLTKPYLEREILGVIEEALHTVEQKKN